MGQHEDPSDYLNRLAKHPRLSRHGGPSSMEQNGGRQKQLKALEDGNWTCEDSSCGNINYPRRIECNKCGKKRGPLGDSIVKAYVDSLKIQRGEKRGELPFGTPVFPSHEVKGQMSDHHQIGGILGRGILGGGGGGEIGGFPPQSSLPLPNMGGQEYWIGNSFESYQEKVFSHHPNYVSEQTLASQYVAGEGGRRSTISAAHEGKRLAEQLVALFAASSDPIGDSGECLASAALWLQTMKARIQIPSSNESPIHSSPPAPSNSQILSLNGPNFGLNGPHFGLNSPNVGLNGSNFGVNTPNFGLNTPNFGSNYQGATVVGNSPMGNNVVNNPVNHLHNNPINSNSVNDLHNNLQIPRNLGVTGAQTIYGIPTKYSSGFSENPIWQNGGGGGGGGVGGGVGGGGGGGGHAIFTSHSSKSILMTPVMNSNTGGRVTLPRPNVKFEDYKDRPSDYLRDFGDPAAVNASGGGGSANQRPEPGLNGNWECEDCKNVNFPRRTSCFQCHKKRGPAGEEIVRNYVRKLIERA